ncbi:MAG TPA: hypothetical protein DCM31_07395 [Deferribacteraceae bacterium]|nr:hypothetical protein [Deferribacteraceae bacterium]
MGWKAIKEKFCIEIMIQIREIRRCEVKMSLKISVIVFIAMFVTLIAIESYARGGGSRGGSRGGSSSKSSSYKSSGSSVRTMSFTTRISSGKSHTGSGIKTNHLLKAAVIYMLLNGSSEKAYSEPVIIKNLNDSKERCVRGNIEECEALCVGNYLLSKKKGFTSAKLTKELQSMNAGIHWTCESILTGKISEKPEIHEAILYYTGGYVDERQEITGKYIDERQEILAFINNLRDTSYISNIQMERVQSSRDYLKQHENRE